MSPSEENNPTLAFYEREARAYAARPRFEAGRSRSDTEIARWMDAFLNGLPPSGHILELGCGSGEDTLKMRTRGFDVRPTDGSTEMAREAAKLLGHPAEVLLFQDLADSARYDGVWANACLLHVPRDDFGDVLLRINRALTDGGSLYASFKAGEKDGTDKLGRYYNYPDPTWLSAAFSQAGAWQDVAIEMEQVNTADPTATRWIHVLARKA